MVYEQINIVIFNVRGKYFSVMYAKLDVLYEMRTTDLKRISEDVVKRYNTHNLKYQPVTQYIYTPFKMTTCLSCKD